MPHPETIPAPGQRKDPRSELLRAQAKAAHGEKVNACPFGCETPELDENGYCRHLIGFTNDGKTFEPMKRKAGRRLVMVERSRVPTGEYDDEGTPEYEDGPPQLPAIPKGAKLVQISTSSRVYLDVDKQPAKEK